jgi:hypothetical protein
MTPARWQAALNKTAASAWHTGVQPLLTPDDVHAKALFLGEEQLCNCGACAGVMTQSMGEPG